MKVIVGLGNPGKEYENTRHNVGFMVVDRLAKQCKVEWELDKKAGSLRALKRDESTEILLVKPQGFMNNSGVAVKKIIGNWKLKIENLYVVHDDLDIKLGEYKIQFGKGPKVHNGVKSIEQQLKTKKFWRVRVGIDNRKQRSINNKQGEEYVLRRFLLEEKKIIEGVVDEVNQAIIERL